MSRVHRACAFWGWPDAAIAALAVAMVIRVTGVVGLLDFSRGVIRMIRARGGATRHILSLGAPLAWNTPGTHTPGANAHTHTYTDSHSLTYTRKLIHSCTLACADTSRLTSAIQDISVIQRAILGGIPCSWGLEGAAKARERRGVHASVGIRVVSRSPLADRSFRVPGWADAPCL